jgi:Zn-dependent peptidase ImmA (M78 family)/DNA-binding XRE family transcriptional regulator
MPFEAYITPSVLRWARERVHLTREMAARRVAAEPERFEAWEEGTARPTFRQAQELAQSFSIPFGYLFLSAPPREQLPLPDLRTVADRRTTEGSPELVDVVADALAKQEWYRDNVKLQGGQPLPFIGRFSLGDGPERIAADIRETIGIDSAMRREAGNWEDFLRAFVGKVENIGVLVLRSGIVGSNTHRPLDVQEFRGFVLSDEWAPLIFINGQDAKAAQIFTLAHELAHLWIGRSGVLNPDYGLTSSEQVNEVERLCNQVAAETLVPKEEFRAVWSKSETTAANVQATASRFRVSALVALRQAYDLKLLSQAEFWAQYNRLLGALPRQKGEGGDFYNVFFSRNGRQFSRALIEALGEGRVTYREAARLLNVKVGTLGSVANRLSGFVA